MAALTRRGMKVQPYKVGPDFIDPSLHRLVCGRASRNLDTWLMPSNLIPELFARNARKADVALIEGVMGFYDGLGGSNDEVSTAQMARILHSPVVLVIDAQGMARSAAAVVLGFKVLDSRINLAGVILNRVAGEKHAEMCRESIETSTGVPVLGAIPLDESIKLPERHLGLIPAPEGALSDTFLSNLAKITADHVDLTRLIEVAKNCSELPEPNAIPVDESETRVKLGVAFDEAFNFYYQDALDYLEQQGAEIKTFSPLHDQTLPAEISGIYIGGGFPEMHAQGLEVNQGMRRSILSLAEDGMPILAECGGMMYLSQSLSTSDQRRHRMVGVLPGDTEMTGRLTLNYTIARTTDAHPFLKPDGEIRSHEFHYSKIVNLPRDAKYAYKLSLGQGIDQNLDGLVEYSTIGSYVHTHLVGCPSYAKAFVGACHEHSAKS
jgi:cobyrinic acid a,c-diamide synthase